MARYNSSAARAYPEEERSPQPVPKKSTTRQIQVVERKHNQNHLAFLNFRTISVFLIIIGVICFMLYNQARLNELDGQIEAVQLNIKQLESEKVRMQSSLESTLSLRSVARQAEQELGLQHLDPYQVEYIFIYEEDRVELLTPQKEGLSDQVDTFVARLVHGIKAFFGES